MKCDVCGESIVLGDLDSYHFSDENDQLTAKCVLCICKEDNKYFFASCAIIFMAIFFLLIFFVLNNIIFGFLTIVFAIFSIVFQLSKSKVKAS